MKPLERLGQVKDMMKVALFGQQDGKPYARQVEEQEEANACCFSRYSHVQNDLATEGTAYGVNCKDILKEKNEAKHRPS